jgi:hypothetical protein
MGITNVVTVNKPVTLESLMTENDLLTAELATLKACQKEEVSTQREPVAMSHVIWFLDVAFATVAVLQTIAIAIVLW